MPARLRSGPVGKLHRQCRWRRHRVRPDEREASADLHSLASLRLLQRARHRRYRQHRRRRHAPRRDQDRGQTRCLSRANVAVSYCQVQNQTVRGLLRGRGEAYRRELSTIGSIALTDARLPGFGLSFRLWLHCYESFETNTVARTGHVPMPASGEHVLGGHAVCAVGYDIKRRWFICRNSWGTSWGIRGYFTIPFAYLTDTDLSADFWTIRVVE